jgi:hypothetical protein
VHNYVDQRIPSHKGADKDRKTVVDLLKFVLNPEVKLPTYVAVDISRLPPVDVEHMDRSALLRELALLHSEVRSIGQVRAELDEVKSTMKVLQQSVHLAVQLEEGDGRDKRKHVQPAPGASSPAVTFASKALDLQHTGMKERAPRKTVVGSSTANRHVKSVETVRTVDIFVSRLHPLTSSGELVECVDSVKGDLKVSDIKCNKLRSKFEDLYSSYHVAVTVSTVCFKSAIDLFSSAEIWPTGVFVKRYFKPRHGIDEDSS